MNFLCSTIACSFLLVSSASAASRPNIILVMADDQGWGDVAYNGHEVLQTPNLDKAAETGLRFDRFYAVAPVCSPTRASVMTGRHPNRMGVFKWGHPIHGIGTPSAKRMSDLLEAQKQGGDLEPDDASRRAAALPKTPFSTTAFPGHAAWIDGDWKLHRIASKKGEVRWELYDLANDAKEKHNLSHTENRRVTQMGKQLEAWLASVARRLNGEDYPREKASDLKDK